MVESLEREMELLCLTGVEDQLQADVRPTLELLRNAGIKVGSEPGPDSGWGRSSPSRLSSGLDADRRQNGDGYLHCQELPPGVPDSGRPRLQAGARARSMTLPLRAGQSG